VESNWVVEIVEQDVFGWEPRLEDTREFKTKLEADRFYNEYSKKTRPGIINKAQYMVARKPREKKPLEDANCVDPPTYSGPEDDDPSL
jgi:hypothetical protein